MDIISTVLIGATAGVLASLAIRAKGSHAYLTVVIGILGAMLGLATDLWLGEGGINTFVYCRQVANSAGAILMLLLWAAAQRLFLAEPTQFIAE